MKIKIIQIRPFSKTVDSLLKKGQLLQADFDQFKRSLAENPEVRDLIPGTGGFAQDKIEIGSIWQERWLPYMLLFLHIRQ